MRLLAVLQAMLAVTCIATTPALAEPLTSLPAPVSAALAANKLDAENFSVYVQDAAQTAPLLTFNAQVPRNPASVMKLVTTIVALHELGPGYTMSTEVYADARPVGGRIDGNLYLKGGGDPFLVTEAFWRLLKDLRHTGLRHVAGDLVIDGSYFDVPDEYRGDFDGKPHRAYNVAPHAALVNFFATYFKLFADEEAGTVRVVVDPPMTTLDLDNRMQLIDGRCSWRRRKVRLDLLSLGPVPRVRLSGTFPRTCDEMRLLRAVADPVPYVFGAFKPMWEEMGGRIDGSGRSGLVPDSAVRLYKATSQPLSELVRIMNKFSNNVMTRNLLLVLGAHTYGAPGTAEKGRNAIADWLLLHDVVAPELRVDNGAGLTRVGQVSALSLARLLIKAWQSPFRAEFAASLPLAAIDGTMKKRLDSTDLEGKVRTKTGLLNGVRSMAGFVRTRSGRDLIVVSLHNEAGVQHGTGTAVQDALLEWLYEQ